MYCTWSVRELAVQTLFFVNGFLFPAEDLAQRRVVLCTSGCQEVWLFWSYIVPVNVHFVTSFGVV